MRGSGLRGDPWLGLAYSAQSLPCQIWGDPSRLPKPGLRAAVLDLPHLNRRKSAEESAFLKFPR